MTECETSAGRPPFRRSGGWTVAPGIIGALLAAAAYTAGLVWSSDLPRQLQPVLFDTADGIPS